MNLLCYYIMMTRSSRCTLFPYTTLFRSLRVGSLAPSPRKFMMRSALSLEPLANAIVVATSDSQVGWLAPNIIHGRSEEHTSELQSHVNLECRLLLEKKNIIRSRLPRMVC